MMAYARFASGYRPGGPNSAPALTNSPPTFSPDKVYSYEVGFKNDIPAYKLSLDASLYYISWRNIQLTTQAPNQFSFIANGSNAKSQGIELTAKATPIDGFTASAWFAYNQADLTQNLPPATLAAGIIGAEGDRLPYSSRYSANLSLEQQFSLGHGLDAYARGTVIYVGQRESTFSTSAAQPRLSLPGYVQENLVAGVLYHSWTANVFVNNLSDQRGQVSTGYFGTTPLPVYILPRQVGLSISKSF
jgi:outer membrane receptor protein involved in Fe transport